MFANLRAEMARRNITGYELAEKIGVTNGTFSKKFNGKADFTLVEAFAIQKALKTDLPVDILFQSDEA